MELEFIYKIIKHVEIRLVILSVLLNQYSKAIAEKFAALNIRQFEKSWTQKLNFMVPRQFNLVTLAKLHKEVTVIFYSMFCFVNTGKLISITSIIRIFRKSLLCFSFSFWRNYCLVKCTRLFDLSLLRFLN